MPRNIIKSKWGGQILSLLSPNGILDTIIYR